MKKSDKSNAVIERIKSAVSVGVTIRYLAQNSGITYYRMASVVNVKSYRFSTTFTDSECDKLNSILDNIKSAF